MNTTDKIEIHLQDPDANLPRNAKYDKHITWLTQQSHDLLAYESETFIDIQAYATCKQFSLQALKEQM